jgi:hypothetical protein
MSCEAAAVVVACRVKKFGRKQVRKGRWFI